MVFYRLKEDNIVNHDFYVYYITISNNDPYCHNFYMNESYIYLNCFNYDDSLFDSNDEQDSEVKVQHEGNNYYLIADIIDEVT